MSQRDHDRTPVSTAERPENDTAPPPPPAGYVLYNQTQQLNASAWLPGQTSPNFHIANGLRYLCVEDVAATATRAGMRTRLYRCPSEEDAPLRHVIRQGIVTQYMYTGNMEEDYEALKTLLDRSNRALRALELQDYVNNAHAAEEWMLRQQVHIVRDSLQNEIDVFRREVNDPLEGEGDVGYRGFDEFDLGMPPLPRRRPKGYKWVCRI